MNIVAGPSSQLLAARISLITNSNLCLTEFEKFPDNELYTRVLDDISEEVTIIQSIVNDSDYISLLQLIDICETIPKINVVIPYMGYSRQDKVFKKGEPISARAIAKTIKADNIFTINIHEESILDYFDGNAINIDATRVIGEYIKNMELQNPLILAPDQGAIYLAKNASKDLNIDYDYLEKKRLTGDTVVITPKNMDVKNRDIVILDDIISTGGTMAEAISLLQKQGANRVFTACIHPVLSNNAILKLFKSGVKGIIGTDTIEKAVSKVSVAKIIADEVIL